LRCCQGRYLFSEKLSIKVLRANVWWIDVKDLKRLSIWSQYILKTDLDCWRVLRTENTTWGSIGRLCFGEEIQRRSDLQYMFLEWVQISSSTNKGNDKSVKFEKKHDRRIRKTKIINWQWLKQIGSGLEFEEIGDISWSLCA